MFDMLNNAGAPPGSVRWIPGRILRIFSLANLPTQSRSVSSSTSSSCKPTEFVDLTIQTSVQLIPFTNKQKKSRLSVLRLREPRSCSVL